VYRAYGLLRPASAFTLIEAVARLQARFAGYTVSLAGTQITVATTGWEIELALNADPAVLAESVAFAEKIAGAEDGSDIQTCGRRVEVWSETPDPFVEHLADFHAVLDVLRTFAGVIVIDPAEPALM